MLSPQQEAFCLNYAETGNATESYLKAGYKVSEASARRCASRLLTNVDIQTRLKEIAERLESDKIASIEEIQSRLTDVLRRTEKENVVVTITEEIVDLVEDANGVPKKVTKKVQRAEVVQIPSRITDSIRAGELLAKMKGAFSTDVNINGAIPIVIHDDL